MKTAMQEIAMVVDNEQDIIDVAELLIKERQQLIDAFVAGSFEGYKGAKGLQIITPDEYIKKTYNDDNK